MDDIITYYIESKIIDIQIGVLIPNWQFLFYSNPRIYDSNKRGINRFLKLHKHDIYIYKSQFISNSFNGTKTPITYLDEIDMFRERTKVSVDDFWEVIEDNKTGLDIRSFFDYPDCLKYYVGEEKFLNSKLLSSKESISVYNRLPTLKRELEQILDTEIIIDNLRWRN